MRARDLLRLKSPLWLLPPLALGVAVMVQGVRSREPVEPGPREESARPVGVVTVERADVRPTREVHGTARPARRWTAVARVPGAVVEVHPELHSGAVVEAGAELVRLEAVDQELAVERAHAELDSLGAQLDELERSAANDRALLEVEREAAAAAERELERTRDLVPTGTASAASADAAERVLLARRASLTGVEGRLALVPARRAALEASRRGARARLREAELDLARTRITAPFAGRLVDAELRTGQYVAPGERLFELHGAEAVEVDARLLPEDLALLGGAEALFGARARVTVTGDGRGTLDGRVVRLRERVEARTRTLGLVVRVEADDRVDVPLPLAGTYCGVTLEGAPLEGRLLVPRSAVRDGVVVVVDDEDRARRRRVEVAERVGDRLAIADGLEAGARVAAVYPVGLPSGGRVAPEERPE